MTKEQQAAPPAPFKNNEPSEELDAILDRHASDVHTAATIGCHKQWSAKCVQLESAQARLRLLTMGVREWIADTDESPQGKHWALLDRLLAEYESKEGET